MALVDVTCDDMALFDVTCTNMSLFVSRVFILLFYITFAGIAL